MSWGVVMKPEDVFKKASVVAQHKTGLKVLIFGEPDTMKTGFALSAVKVAPPVFFFDTELGAPPLFQYFKEDLDNIQWCDATFLDPKSDLPDPLAALQKLENSITAIKQFTDMTTTGKPIAGTIVIDSLTDVWDWIQEWLSVVGKKSQSGQLLRFSWTLARRRIKQLIFRLIAKPVHLICTAHPQEIYVDGEPSGRLRPRVEGALPHRFDIVIHAKRYEIPSGTQYKAVITKCRFKKGWRPTFDEITFQKLLNKLKTDLGVEVW